MSKREIRNKGKVLIIRLCQVLFSHNMRHSATGDTAATMVLGYMKIYAHFLIHVPTFSTSELAPPVDRLALGKKN